MADATGTTTYTYTPLNAIDTVTFPGSRTVDYDYDNTGRRSQIEHGSNRHPLHLAQVIQMALRSGPSGPAVGPPEDHIVPAPPSPDRAVRALGLGLGLAAASLAVGRRAIR